MELSEILEILKLLGSVAIIFAPLYYLYVYFTSSILERVLMKKKEKFFAQATYWTLFIIGAVIVTYATAGTHIFFIYLDMIIFALAVFLVTAYKDIVTFEYEGHEYNLLSYRTDSEILVSRTGEPTSTVLPADILHGRKLHERNVFRYKKDSTQKHS